MRSTSSILSGLFLCLPLACSDDTSATQTGAPSETSIGPGDGDEDQDQTTNGDGDGDSTTNGDGDGDAPTTNGDEDSDNSEGSGVKFDLEEPPDTGGDGDCIECSSDYLAVVGCGGQLIQECNNGTACDPGLLTCLPACDVAEANKFSIGCEYFPVRLDSLGSSTYCYAAFVSNPWNVNAHIDVEFNGMPLAVENFAYAPNGVGPNLSYDPYDPDVGIPPGEMVILLLSGDSGGAPRCPFPSAVPNGATFNGTGTGSAFRVESDVPVVAYQMNPYGGGSTAVTGASLLLPSSAWDTDYITTNAYVYDLANPTLNVVAATDNTEVTIWPVTNLVGGGGLPPGPANQPYVFNLDAGEHAQFSQQQETTGSVLVASEPVGVFSGHACLRVPTGVAFCDHAEEMIPPVGALGSEYAGVMHQPRGNEPSVWRIVGAIDGTQLSWEPAVGGPPQLQAGEVAEFITDEAFVVTSQDEDHPFMLMNYMSGSQWNQIGLPSGYGDPEYAISVPTDQYLTRYVFFADPSYPETAITIIRRAVDGQFRDVELDCLGVVGGWTPLGEEFEWTRVQLIEGDFQDVGNCSTGTHEISSEGSFGLWVWGWGTPLTQSFTSNVSYGYPGGMNVATINSVNIDPEG